MFWTQDVIEGLKLGLPSASLAGCMALAGGTLGVPTLLKRHSLAALALPQAVAIGVALSLRWGAEGWALPMAILAVASVVAFLASAKNPAQIDALVAGCYVGGLCVTMLILANAGQHLEDIQHWFVGMDVAVDWHDFRWSAPGLLLLAAVSAVLWRRWVLMVQMPAVGELAGLNPVRWHYLFMSLMSIALMVGTHAQGVVMVLSLLFLPAAAVLPWTRRVPTAMAAAAVLGVLFVAAGDVMSNAMNWPFSQSVGGAGFAVLVASRLTALVARRSL